MNDIYAYFDYHGTLKERVSAPIRANSTQGNSIYAYWDNQSVEPVTYSVTWRLVGSDSFETTSEHYAETLAIPANYLRRRDLVFFKEAKLYNFIRFPVPSAVTAVAGTYVATIRYALSTQATFVLGSLTFDVEGDRGIVLGESLTLDQYNYLLEQYSEVYDWATLRFLPLTGGTLTGDLTIDGHDLTAERVFAKAYWLSSPDKAIIKLDNSVGDLGELQFGIPSGDYSPAFYGSLGVDMWDGREKVYPYVKFNYYDENDEYETTDYEMIATQQWSNAMYLRLAGGTVTGPVIFNSPTTFYRPPTINSGMTVSGFESHGGDEYHSGTVVFLNNITITADSPTQAYHAVRKDYVDNLLASVKANAYQVVQALPQSGEEGIIYLVPVQGEDYYTQYIWESNDWLDIGDTDIDLSGYLPLTGGTITGDLAIDGSVTLGGKDLETELSEKADKTGYYGTMGAGYADTAKSLQTSVGRADETPFAFQTTGGSSDVETGIQQPRKLVGVSVVENQHSDIDYYFTAGSGEYGMVRTKNTSAQTYKINGTCADGYYVNSGLTSSSMPKLIKGHKYLWGVMLLSGSVDSSAKTTSYATNGYFIVPRTVYSSDLEMNVKTAGSSWFLCFEQSADPENLTIAWTCDTGVAFTNAVFQFRLIDLTQRYGNNTVVNAIIGTVGANDPADIQVRRLLQFDPSILKQTAYDAGTLSSSQSAKLKSVGYNQFDGEWEVGGFNNDNTYNCHSKNFIPVIGGQSYTFENGDLTTSASNALYWREYDANKNEINRNQDYSALSSANKKTTFTLKPNACYVKMMLFIDGGYNFTNNFPTSITLHLTWDGSKTGFEPYESQTYDLPNIVQRGVLKVDGDGNVYAYGDVAYPDGTGETRYGIVDLADVDFIYNPSAKAWQAPISGMKGTSGWSDLANAICEKYTQVSTNAGYGNEVVGSFYINPSSSLYINNGSSETKPSGKLIYELATPTPITFDAFPENVWADDFGTMQFLDSDGNEIVGLQGADFFYQANIAGFAESVYVKTDGDPEKIVYEDEVYAKAQADARFALKEALGGTLRQVLAVKESLDFANTAYKDLGDLNWTRDGTNGYFYAADVGIKKPADNNTSAKMISTLYINGTWNTSASGATGVNMNMGVNASTGWLGIRNTAYTDATAFKAAMAGVLLAYEKA